MTSVQGKVALITGAGGGIGRGLSLAFAQAGASLIANDINEPAAQETARLVQAQGGTCLVDASDISDARQVRGMVARGLERFGRIDILINNAGRIDDSLIQDMREDQWDSVVNLCLRGSFLCAREVVPAMLRQASGRIINIASMSYRGNVGQTNYAAAKAGIVGMTQSLGLELARKGITVNCIAPGLIRTPATDDFPPEVRERLVRMIPARSIGTPEDVAAAALFFASDAARYVTRQVLHVSGGSEGF